MLSTVKNWALFWLVAGITIIATLVGYAAIGSSWTSPSSYEATSTTTLSSTSWNNVLADVANLDARSVPTGAVMAFYGTSCPNGWSAADGSTTVKKTDGSSSTLDLRGEFIRGLDSAGVGARGVDSGRGLGSWQKPSSIPHEHGNSNIVAWDFDGTNSSSLELAWFEKGSLNWYPTWASLPNSNLIGRSGWYNFPADDLYDSVVRPRNVALLYCIKN